MKKLILMLSLLLAACGTVTDPYTFTGGTSASATQVNARFNELYTEMNGNLDSTNIKDNSIETGDILNDTITHSDIAGIASQPVGETDTQTLTNKTLTTPTITSPTISGTVAGGASYTSPTITGTPTAAGATWTDLGTVTTADINGGTLDGVTIGGASAAAGTFTSVTATTADINGGTIDGTVIGATTPAAGTFTSVTATALYNVPKTESRTIVLPEYVQAQTDFMPILAVETSWAPNGITITDCGIKTNENSTYSVNFEEWTSPTDGAPSTIEAVATAGNTEAEDNGTIDDGSIAVGSIVGIDLPTTTGLEWLQVWITYKVNP